MPRLVGKQMLQQRVPYFYLVLTIFCACLLRTRRLYSTYIHVYTIYKQQICITYGFLGPQSIDLTESLGFNISMEFLLFSCDIGHRPLTGDEEKPEKSPEDFPSLPPDEPLDPKYVDAKWD